MIKVYDIDNPPPYALFNSSFLMIPRTVVEFSPEALSAKELNHARLTAKTKFVELIGYARIMKSKKCSYTAAVIQYHKENKNVTVPCNTMPKTSKRSMHQSGSTRIMLSNTAPGTIQNRSKS